MDLRDYDTQVRRRNFFILISMVAYITGIAPTTTDVDVIGLQYTFKNLRIDYLHMMAGFSASILFLSCRLLKETHKRV